MAKRKKPTKKGRSPLDRFSEKRPRGRPGTNKAGIAYLASRLINGFERSWDSLEGPLLKARTEAQVKSALSHAKPYVQQDLRNHLSLIPKICREATFPTRSKARMRYLAESLAGRGEVSPRRSRDICAYMRKHPPTQILRREFYIVCSCGYEGHSLHECCPDCGAIVPGALLSAFPH